MLIADIPDFKNIIRTGFFSNPLNLDLVKRLTLFSLELCLNRKEYHHMSSCYVSIQEEKGYQIDSFSPVVVFKKIEFDTNKLPLQIFYYLKQSLEKVPEHICLCVPCKFKDGNRYVHFDFNHDNYPKNPEVYSIFYFNTKYLFTENCMVFDRGKNISFYEPLGTAFVECFLSRN